MRRRLDVALDGARATCLHQVDALHESLGVLGRSGFTDASAYQAALLGHRVALEALERSDAAGALAIMERVVALCATMEEAIRALHAFAPAAAGQTTLVSPPST